MEIYIIVEAFGGAVMNILLATTNQQKAEKEYYRLWHDAIPRLPSDPDEADDVIAEHLVSSPGPDYSLYEVEVTE